MRTDIRAIVPTEIGAAQYQHIVNGKIEEQKKKMRCVAKKKKPNKNDEK